MSWLYLIILMLIIFLIASFVAKTSKFLLKICLIVFSAVLIIKFFF